jgi:hypothetical protein
MLVDSKWCYGIQPVNALRIIMQHCQLLIWLKVRNGVTMGSYKVSIIRPELFDWKIGAKQAAVRFKYGDGFVNDIGNKLCEISKQPDW